MTSLGAVDPVAVADELRRADVLRRSVDVACALLRQARMTREEAEAVVAFTRARALELFPVMSTPSRSAKASESRSTGSPAGGSALPSEGGSRIKRLA